MSKESQNFLQRMMQAYTDYNPLGANDRAVESFRELDRAKNEYTEDEYVERVDPLKPERGVTPSIAERLLLGINRSDFTDAGGRMNIRELEKTDDGREAARLNLEIYPNSTPEKLAARVKRKKNENLYDTRSTKDPNINIEDLTDEALDEQLRISGNKQEEIETYGTLQPSGQRTGGSVKGNLELSRADEELKSSKSARNVNEGNLNLNQLIARNNQTQQDYNNSWNEYAYEDKKVENEIERQFLAAQADAEFAANLETIKLQNAAETARYEMLLENDRDVRRSESISDLIASLVLFGGQMNS